MVGPVRSSYSLMTKAIVLLRKPLALCQHGVDFVPGLHEEAQVVVTR